MSKINWTKKTPIEGIQGSDMAPYNRPRTPNASQMTAQIAPKSTLGATRVPSGASQAADVAPWHQKSSKIVKNTKKPWEQIQLSWANLTSVFNKIHAHGDMV